MEKVHGQDIGDVKQLTPEMINELEDLVLASLDFMTKEEQTAVLTCPTCLKKRMTTANFRIS